MIDMPGLRQNAGFPSSFQLGLYNRGRAGTDQSADTSAARLLDIGQGREKRSPYWTAPMERPFVAEVGRTPGKLRVALVSESLTGIPLDPAIRKSLDETVKLLLALGHEVDAARLPLQPQQLFGAHGAVIGSASFTVPANVGGQPSMSVSLGWSDDSLPVGMMFVAAIGNEALLFRLAGQLERERPWAQRRAAL